MSVIHKVKPAHRAWFDESMDDREVVANVVAEACGPRVVMLDIEIIDEQENTLYRHNIYNPGPEDCARILEYLVAEGRFETELSALSTEQFIHLKVLLRA